MAQTETYTFAPKINPIEVETRELDLLLISVLKRLVKPEGWNAALDDAALKNGLKDHQIEGLKIFIDKHLR